MPTYLWLVTFVTHNSRVSERMVEYGVQRGEPLTFSPDEQVMMLSKILEACQGHDIKPVAANILPDHVHMILLADSLPVLKEHVRKIKGYSAYVFQRAQNREPGHPTWAQKFHFSPIQNEEAFVSMLQYVRENHLKHADSWGDGLLATWEERLKPLVEAACISVEAALAYRPGSE
jgi:REP element-mobilizing transposase RayT